MVVSIAKQFVVLHNAVKFEALHFLSAFLFSNYSRPVCDALCVMKNSMWSTYVHVGVVAISQNRVTPVENLHALILAESVMSIVGEGWLFGQMNLPHDVQEPIPADRCILLVLESSRVEISVLLNELSYFNFEASKSSLNVETIFLTQRNLYVVFSLVEKIIKLVASFADDEGGVISESTFTKIISGLNETIGKILEYLQDANVHGHRKGDDLIGSVRIIWSYLSEAPMANREKVIELLDYMLSIEGEDEVSPFYSICFLLHMLCQTTMESDGCKVVASSGSYKAVLECLIKMIELSGDRVEDTTGSIFLACDTLTNLLLKREHIPVHFHDSGIFKLLGTLSHWTEDTGDYSVIMMASSICALIHDLISDQGALLRHSDFDNGKLTTLSRLIRRSLTVRDAAKVEADLCEIVFSGYSGWAEPFPNIKEAVEK